MNHVAIPTSSPATKSAGEISRSKFVDHILSGRMSELKSDHVTDNHMIPMLDINE